MKHELALLGLALTKIQTDDKKILEMAVLAKELGQGIPADQRSYLYLTMSHLLGKMNYDINERLEISYANDQYRKLRNSPEDDTFKELEREAQMRAFSYMVAAYSALEKALKSNLSGPNDPILANLLLKELVGYNLGMADLLTKDLGIFTEEMNNALGAIEDPDNITEKELERIHTLTRNMVFNDYFLALLTPEQRAKLDLPAEKVLDPIIVAHLQSLRAQLSPEETKEIEKILDASQDMDMLIALLSEVKDNPNDKHMDDVYLILRELHYRRAQAISQDVLERFDSSLKTFFGFMDSNTLSSKGANLVVGSGLSADPRNILYVDWLMISKATAPNIQERPNQKRPPWPSVLNFQRFTFPTPSSGPFSYTKRPCFPEGPSTVRLR